MHKCIAPLGFALNALNRRRIEAKRKPVNGVPELGLSEREAEAIAGAMP